MKRDKSMYKDVYIRDLGLCQCCGFKADEVHHIVPLSMGGSDDINNLICLCSFDHYHAPNTKEEFIIYQKHGGVKLDNLMGRAVNNYFQHPELNKDITLSEFIEGSRKLINTLRQIDIDNCIELYGSGVVTYA